MYYTCILEITRFPNLGQPLHKNNQKLSYKLSYKMLKSYFPMAPHLCPLWMTVSNNDLHCFGRRSVKGPCTPITDLVGVHEKHVMSQNKIKIKLLRCIRKIHISMFNARTLIRPDQIEGVIVHAELLLISTICLQEHRIFYQDSSINY